MIFENSPLPWVAPKKMRFWKLRFAVKALWIVFITFALMIPFLMLRHGQRIFGVRHSEHAIYRIWGKLSWFGFSIKPRIYGTPIKGDGLIVANHSNWLDIPLLFGSVGGFMVSKADVKDWPVIGFFARILGTQFVDRKRSNSKAHADALLDRMVQGERMVFFPEGTSTDGLRVLPFRSTLFEAAVQSLPEKYVQPVTIFYYPPEGASPNFFGWWGEMSFADSIIAIVALPKRQVAEVHFHEPILIGTDRKALAKQCEAVVVAKFRELLEAREGRHWDQ